jgi:dephospho-CoA kinase
MIVGLTGGIGSGKSAVAGIFEVLGCSLFNSDAAARCAYFEPDARKKVVELLGSEAYFDENRINRSYISSKIFSDTTLLHQLNDIIHPVVKTMFTRFAEKHKDTLIIKETALLFEARLGKQVDKIILVAADDALRIDRVMKRDDLSRDEVLKKMKSQLPQEEKIKHSHFVIYNNEKDSLISQVLKIYEQLKKEM